MRGPLGRGAPAGPAQLPGGPGDAGRVPVSPVVIEVDQLTKRFGPVTAGLSFTVRPGHVTGFLGPNGAGKTTTMRVILGLDAPTSGRALVGGRRYQEILVQGAHDSFNGRPVDYFCGGHEVVLRGLETTSQQWRAQTAIYSGGQYTMGPAEGISIAWYRIPARS
jgi:ATPase subunit of ABC transporter with duplicated ATPase domains